MKIELLSICLILIVLYLFRDKAKVTGSDISNKTKSHNPSPPDNKKPYVGKKRYLPDNHQIQIKENKAQNLLPYKKE